MMSKQPKIYDEPYARHYDLLYADKDYASEVKYVQDILQRLAPETISVLELGSGTGRHAAGLTSSGFAVHGVEQSEAMLTAAVDTAPPRCTFSLGDVRDVRLGRTFDAALSLFHVMSYQTTNRDFGAALATARAHLNPGGILLFDCWYGPAVLHNKPSVRIKQAKDDTVQLTRIATPTLLHEENIVIVDYKLLVRDRDGGKLTEYDERHRVRYFFVPEIELFLARAGFRLEGYEEWLSGGRLSLESWYAVYFASAL